MHQSHFWHLTRVYRREGRPHSGLIKGSNSNITVLLVQQQQYYVGYTTLASVSGSLYGWYCPYTNFRDILSRVLSGSIITFSCYYAKPKQISFSKKHVNNRSRGFSISGQPGNNKIAEPHVEENVVRYESEMAILTVSVSSQSSDIYGSEVSILGFEFPISLTMLFKPHVSVIYNQESSAFSHKCFIFFIMTHCLL